MNVLLTTYPEHASRNVGDSLISNSAIDLIRRSLPSYEPKVVWRGAALDDFDASANPIRTIVAPGFSVSDGVYPNLYTLYSSVLKLDNFYPIGCSLQTALLPGCSFDNFKYSNETQDFLAMLVEKFGPLPCRDRVIVKILESNGINAVYSGDLGLFDAKLIHQPFKPPAEIASAVFTTAHSPKYGEQSKEVLRLIKRALPESKLYIALHSRPTGYSVEATAFAVDLGYTELPVFGDSRQLKVYDSIDLHIGYRLHGHISFLRRKKPSVLLVEDVRSYGIFHTTETSEGCFLAFLRESLDVDSDAPSRALSYVTSQISERFDAYSACLRNIEDLYDSFLSPYFNNLSRNISLAQAG